MWFFLVQTLVVLAAAMGLGVLAGWLLFGGPTSTPKPLDAANSVMSASPAGLEYASTDLVSTEFVSKDTGFRSDLHSFAEVDVQLSSIAAIDNGPADADPLRAAAFAELSVQPSAIQSSAMQLLAAQSLAAQVSAPKSSALQSSVPQASVPQASAPQSSLVQSAEMQTAEMQTVEMQTVQAQLDARSADVARLKLKLRKAVDEIERRTAQTVAARDARDAERRRVASLEAELAALPSADTLPSVDQKTLLDLEAELEKAKLRAGQLAIEVEELAMSHAKLQSSTEAERQALTVEAASLRLRTEGALDQLNEFSREVANFHAEHSQHLARSQQLMTELQAKLSIARSALAGRSQGAVPSFVTPDSGSHVLPNAPVSVTAGESPLLQLPGMTPEVLASMVELGVSSLQDIARWSGFDVQRIQGWMPEYPNIVEKNRWVERARALVRRERETAGLVSGS